MKIYISVDLEGICGVAHWDEVTPGNEEYPESRKQMTAETAAACRGALAAGADEIYVKDAHDSARNIIAEELPEQVRLIRGWSRHPYMMMQELDSSFAASIMIGYHSGGGSPGNPLSHTMSNSRVSMVTINSQPASEFMINSYTSMLEKVPVVLVSGDSALCEHAVSLIPDIHTVAVKHGAGDSTINLHPGTACRKIETKVREALSGDPAALKQELPSSFETIITYHHHKDAYKNSFFPGAELVAPQTIRFLSDDYFKLLQLYLFAL